MTSLGQRINEDISSLLSLVIVGSFFEFRNDLICLPFYFYNSPSPSRFHFRVIENLRTVIVTADIHQGL